MENRNILIGLGTGLVAGLIGGFGIGYSVASHEGHSPAQAAPAALAPQPMPPAANPMGQAQVEAFSRIETTKAALAANPKDVDAWVSLGNDCFDTHQPQAAVDAYAKALALAPQHPHAADILTDQGIMYRELKAYDKALANFKKANALKPQHLPSLLNIGIVYATDLKDPASAKKAWNKIIETAPASPQAEQARAFLAGI